MNRKQKAAISLSVIIMIMVSIFGIWYFSPKTFLKGIEADEIKAISVFDGNTGRSFDIIAPKEIEYIVENIRSTKMERGKVSINYSGFSFRMSFCDASGKVLDSFIINSPDTIRSDPFFYSCDGGLCYDYLRQLEDQYAK
ncbi:MAG: hypothetical protein ACI3XF_03915 [Eubacteriales bacterium]